MKINEIIGNVDQHSKDIFENSLVAGEKTL